MRGTRGEIQDRLLSQWDKTNRNNKTEKSKEPTLAEQLAELEKHENLSPAQKLMKLELTDWLTEFELYLRKNQIPVTTKCLNWLRIKRASEIGVYRKNGTPFAEIATWAMEQQQIHSNL